MPLQKLVTKAAGWNQGDTNDRLFRFKLTEK
jgi:hypothetical protein